MVFRKFVVNAGYNRPSVYKKIQREYGEPREMERPMEDRREEIYDSGEAILLVSVSNDSVVDGVSDIKIGGSEDGVANVIKELDLENLAEEKK